MSAPAPDLEIQAAARLLAEGRPDDAASVLERLVGGAPAYAAGHVLLARALEAAGRPAAALEAWHRAHFLVPTSPLVRRERQRLLDAAPADRAPEVGSDAPDAEAMSSEEDVEVAGGREAQAPVYAAAAPAEEEVAPIDALWADDAPPAGTGPPPLPSQPPMVPAPAAADQEADDTEPSEMEAFDLAATPGDDIEAALPPDVPAAESSRVFAEDAFDATEAVGEPAVFTAVQDLSMDERPGSRDTPERPYDDDEGWALIDETEHERTPSVHPMEAAVAPPTGWELVPASGGAATEPTVRPSSLEWDLDALIREIEEAPRIRPDPHFVPPTADDRPPAAEDDEDVVSETLARIYEAQGQFVEAAAVYEKLAGQRHDRADEFRRRARDLRVRSGA